MPSTTEDNCDTAGIGNSGDHEGGDKKRIKLDIQQVDEENNDDSGLEEEFDVECDIDDGSGDDDFHLIHVDQRPLAERCFGPPFQYWILSAGQAYQKMISCVEECQRILDHSATTVRILLNHRKWDIGKLYDDYYGSDLSQIFIAAGLPDPNPTVRSSAIELSRPTECMICYCTFEESNFFTVACGHSFCHACWQSYICTKVMASAGQEKIECPAQSCNFILEDDIVLEKIQVAQGKEMYKKQITERYVQSNRRMNWCPGNNCPGRIVELEQGSTNWCPVTCTCSHCFCFLCRHEWHGPINCSCLKKWKKKCADDSETVNWISVNTKRCPKCDAPIEKNGGCNHMTCTSFACKHEFCWICLGDWNTHNRNNYNCNRYTEDTNKKSQLESHQSSLNRYLFYFDRYFNHHKSLKSETELIQKMDLQMNEFDTQGISSVHDLQFMKKAVQVLCQCRQTLMYTYVFAYYLERNNNATIFEDNQSDLQRATEELSGDLQLDFVYEKEGLEALKRNIMNKTNYCESRCEVLLKHVYEGYEENYWAYIDPEES